MRIVPAAGHLVHMPGHIWLRVGDYEVAGDVNENAAVMDEDYMQKTGVSSSSYAGYYVHNLHFVVYARAMEGRRKDTLQAAEKLANAASPLASVMPMMVDAFVPSPFFAMIRFQQWDQLLQVKAPDPKLAASRALWHFGRATALAAKGQRPQARVEQRAFEEARLQVPPDWVWLNNKASDVLKVATAIIDARLSSSDADAIAHWRRAVSAEDALSYDEPPPWFYPVRESLGGALLRSGQTTQAEEVFREGLRQSPRNGRILFGLMESLKAQGKLEAAQMVQKEYQTAWKNSDVTLRLEDL
jgi:tetratricopeptide (TPR) repeat protein